MDWSAAKAVAVQATNVFAAQAHNEYHVLNLGFAAPPVIIDQADLQRVNKLKRLPAHVVARVLLTPTDMRKLAKVLSDNIKSHERLISEEQSTK